MARILENRITPEVVGRYLGMSAQAVRRHMEDGSLPIGIVNDNGNGKKEFLIFPKPLYEITGIKLNGYEPPTANIVNFPELNINVLAQEIVNALISNIKNERGAKNK